MPERRPFTATAPCGGCRASSCPGEPGIDTVRCSAGDAASRGAASPRREADRLASRGGAGSLLRSRLSARRSREAGRAGTPSGSRSTVRAAWSAAERSTAAAGAPPTPAGGGTTVATATSPNPAGCRPGAIRRPQATRGVPEAAVPPAAVGRARCPSQGPLASGASAGPQHRVPPGRSRGARPHAAPGGDPVAGRGRGRGLEAARPGRDLGLAAGLARDRPSLTPGPRTASAPGGWARAALHRGILTRILQDRSELEAQPPPSERGVDGSGLGPRAEGNHNRAISLPRWRNPPSSPPPHRERWRLCLSEGLDS